MDDPRVHEALERLAADAPQTDGLWDRTQRRITDRRRTRALVSGAVVVALLLGAAGVFAAVTSNGNDNRVAAGRADASRPPDHVLAVVNRRLEVRSAANGSLGRHIDQVQYGATVDDVATVPGAAYFVYVQTPTPRRTEMPLGGPLVRARPDGAGTSVVTTAAAFAPTVSPNGRLLAYRVTNRYGVTQIALRDLRTLQPVDIVDPSSRQYSTNLTETGFQIAEPLAWTPDSKRLLINDGTGSYVLLGVGEQAAPVIPMPHTVVRAVFMSDDQVAIAYRSEVNGPDSLAVYYLGSGALRPVVGFEAIRDSVVTRLSFDPASGTLLVTAVDNDRRAGRLLTVNASGSHVSPKVGGLTSASWFAPPSSPPSSPPSTTGRAGSINVPNVVVPDLLGMQLVDGNRALSEVGLVSHPVTDSQAPATGKVVWQDPPPGTRLDTGAGVWLWSCSEGAKCALPPSTFLEPFHNTLGWRRMASNDPLLARFAGRHFDTPEELANVIVADLRRGAEAPGNVTETIADRVAASAQIWIQSRNLPDDSIDGADYEFAAVRSGDTWTLRDGRVRTLCVRGVASADSCL